MAMTAAAVPGPARRTIRWRAHAAQGREAPGLEHLLLRPRHADGIVLACDETSGPFRLHYRLAWDDAWRLRDALLAVIDDDGDRSLQLSLDVRGHWRRGDGIVIDALAGCVDIDIWPTPFTNTFPIRRARLAIGERREFRVAWVCAPRLTVEAQAQAYTRLAPQRYLFESLDGSGFRAELDVDDDGVVLDYPGLFDRI